MFLPFNLGKYILNAALTMLIYKPIVTALRKANLLAPSSSDAAPVQKKQHLGTILVSLLILITCILGFLVCRVCCDGFYPLSSQNVNSSEKPAFGSVFPFYRLRPQMALAFLLTSANIRPFFFAVLPNFLPR